MSLGPPINPLVAATGAPPIPEAQRWLAGYDGSCGAPIDLSQAVPGYPPHPGLLDRLGAAAASAEAARYGPILGDDGLRAAFANHLGAAYGARLGVDEVAITAGCNLAFVIAAMLLARSGDAVILPTPWYFNYQMSLAMLGIEARPLPCRAGSGFVPDPEEARSLIDDRVRAIVLVSPNNPTGAVYPPAVIARFADLCRQAGIRLVLDETYADFLPPGTARAHALFADEAWREVVIRLSSFSKSYCIPGHRLGAVVASKALIGELAKILDCLQICPPRSGQAALAWAFAALAAWRGANRAEIHARAEACRKAFDELTSWSIASIGAYFAYLRHPFQDRSAAEVAAALARRRGVLALPGSFFGPQQDGFLRLAFANVGAPVIATLPARLAGFSL